MSKIFTEAELFSRLISAPYKGTETFTFPAFMINPRLKQKKRNQIGNIADFVAKRNGRQNIHARKTKLKNTTN